MVNLKLWNLSELLQVWKDLFFSLWCDLFGVVVGFVLTLWRGQKHQAYEKVAENGKCYCLWVDLS